EGGAFHRNQPAAAETPPTSNDAAPPATNHTPLSVHRRLASASCACSVRASCSDASGSDCAVFCASSIFAAICRWSRTGPAPVAARTVPATSATEPTNVNAPATTLSPPPVAVLQSAEQPSPSLVLPSSHTSPAVCTPLPQRVRVQLRSQPSPSLPLPSS